MDQGLTLDARRFWSFFSACFRAESREGCTDFARPARQVSVLRGADRLDLVGT